MHLAQLKIPPDEVLPFTQHLTLIELHARTNGIWISPEVVVMGAEAYDIDFGHNVVLFMQAGFEIATKIAYRNGGPIGIPKVGYGLHDGRSGSRASGGICC